MSREMTNKEAISNLNHIYGIVSSDIQRSLDLAIKALEERPQGEWLFTEIDENYHVYGQCSVCKERNRIGKACRSCGAEMRGGTEC